MTDAITREGALEMLTKQATTKGIRKEEVKRVGHTAYVTSDGWLEYDDDNVPRLTLEALHQRLQPLQDEGRLRR